MLVPLLFSLGVRERETLSHYIFKKKKKKVWQIYLESDPMLGVPGCYGLGTDAAPDVQGEQGVGICSSGRAI